MIRLRASLASLGLGTAAVALVWFPLRVGSAWIHVWAVLHDVVVGGLLMTSAIVLVRMLRRRGSWQRDVPLVYFAVCMISILPRALVPTLGISYARMQWVTLATYAGVYLCSYAASRMQPGAIAGILAAWFSWAIVSSIRTVIGVCLSGRLNHDAADAMGHVNSRAGFELGIALFLIGIVVHPGPAPRRATVPLLLVLLLSIVLSLSRGAWLGLLAGGTLGVALRWGWRRAATVALVLVAVALVVPGPVGARMRTMVDPRFPTNVFRLSVWREALSLIGENPWGGAGYDTLWFAMLSRLGADLPSLAGRHVHSLPLQTWAETGLLGFGALSVVVVAAFRYARRADRLTGEWMGPVGRGLMVYLAGTIAHGLVDCTWRDYGQQIVFWGLVGWLFAVSQRGESAESMERTV